MDAARRQIIEKLLPKVASGVARKYAAIVPANATAFISTAHLQVWRNALLERDADAISIRTALLRLGYAITNDTLAIIDDHVAGELIALAASCDRDEKTKIENIVASTLGALSLAAL